jgi:hypothetical protein
MADTQVDPVVEDLMAALASDLLAGLEAFIKVDLWDLLKGYKEDPWVDLLKELWAADQSDLRKG